MSASAGMQWLSVAVVFAAALVSAGLIVAIRPVLSRHFLAAPNERSSHAAATPQGAGIAVIAAIVLVAGLAAAMWPQVARADLVQLAALLTAVACLALLGAFDDARSLGAWPKLVVQTAIVAALIAWLPSELRLAPALPLWAERVLAIVAGIWCVNAVNFMDGIDWMTVAEIVPVSAAFAILAMLGAMPPPALLVALALLGATLGFAPFNRPVAKLFLGDAGSLPIGLLLFWLMLQLAGSGHVLAALMLPLCYLADTVVTFARRTARGEPIMQAHRSHFYQVAVARGFSVTDVVRSVFAVNVLLAALAIAAVMSQTPLAEPAAFVVAVLVVAGLLAAMARGRR